MHLQRAKPLAARFNDSLFPKPAFELTVMNRSGLVHRYSDISMMVDTKQGHIE